MRYYLHCSVFSCFDTIPECDRQTDTRQQGIYCSSIVSCDQDLNNINRCKACAATFPTIYCLCAFCIPVAFSLVKIVVLSNAVEVGLLVAVRVAVSLTVMLVAEVLSAKTVLFSIK